MVEGDFPDFDVILGDVDDRKIVGQSQGTVIGLADTLVNLELDIAMIPVVVRHRQAGLHLGHQLAEALRRRMNQRGNPVGLLVGKAGNLHPVLRGEKALVHHHIGTFGFFRKPLVRNTVPTEHEDQPIPLEAETDRTVKDIG